MHQNILRKTTYVTLIMAVVVGCSDSEEGSELALETDPATAEEASPPQEEGASLSDDASAGAETDSIPMVPMDDSVTIPPASPSLPTPAESSQSGGAGSAADSGNFAYIMPMEASQFMWVFTDHLVVRNAPTAAASKLGKLRWGKKVAVLAEQDGWVKIGDNAWAGREHLTDRVSRWFGSNGQNAVENSSVTGEMSGVANVFRVSAFTLNVRDQPGRQGKILHHLTHGMLVRGRLTDTGWVEIAPGQFVSGNWLSPGSGPVAH